MNGGNKNERQWEYLRRHAANIAAFAKVRHARCGRGIVIIGWPEQDFPKPEEIPEDAGYIRTELLTSEASEDSISSDPVLQAAARYNPEQQAIVLFIDSTDETLNLHVLTAVYGYAN